MANKTLEALKVIPLIAFVLMMFNSAFAQFNLGFIREPTIPYLQQGTLPNYSTAGGLNTPQFSEIDLDGDGFLDIFIFDRSVDVVKTYVYHPLSSSYRYSPQYERFFPKELAEFVLLRDFNCDGLMDIFTYHRAGFRVFQNVTPAGGELEFIKVTDQVRSDYGAFETAAFVLAGDVPAIVDVDGDGDLDILTFGTVNSESTIEFHRNLSIDLYASCDSLIFEVVTQCWGNVQEAVNTSILTPINCKGVSPPSGEGERFHPGSALILIDTDGDGDKDLIVGDIQTDHVVYAKNAGDAQVATIDVSSQTQQFPNAQNPVAIQYLVAGYELDVNKDSIPDLVMTVNNSIDSSANTDHIWYYRNTATSGTNYVLEQTDFLLDEVFDVGANTSVVALHLNDDDMIDLLIASDYKRTPTGSNKSRIYRFDQIPGGVFNLVDEDYADLSFFNFGAVQLSAADLDNDGDEDLLIGDADGFLHYFRNNPIGGNANHMLVSPQYMGINTIGNNASPALGDINGDGLIDLVVGERTGVLSYFQNTGTANQAQFSASPTITSFGGIDVSERCCAGYATPQIINDPQFGNGLFLVVGSDEKRIDVFQIPSNLNTDFPRIDSIIVNGGRLDPLIVQLYEDQPLVLLAGEAGGGLLSFFRDFDYPVGFEPVSNAEDLVVKVFPNPSYGVFNLEMSYRFDGVLSVYNSHGVMVYRNSFAGKEMELNLSVLPAGLYNLILASSNAIKTEPILILK